MSTRPTRGVRAWFRRLFRPSLHDLDVRLETIRCYERRALLRILVDGQTLQCGTLSQLAALDKLRGAFGPHSLTIELVGRKVRMEASLPAVGPVVGHWLEVDRNLESEGES